MKKQRTGNLSPSTEMKGGKTTAEKENTTNKIVTIQTTEGKYEATLSEDNANNFPLQEKLGLASYSISKPPKTMRNIPMYHTTRQLQNGQILKFDDNYGTDDRRTQNTTHKNAS